MTELTLKEHLLSVGKKAQETLNDGAFDTAIGFFGLYLNFTFINKEMENKFKQRRELSNVQVYEEAFKSGVEAAIHQFSEWAERDLLRHTRVLFQLKEDSEND
jgi:hypothetical protein